MLTSSRKNLELLEIAPHWKIGPRLLCGRMDAVMKNLFSNLKLDLFLVLKANFYCDFLIPNPKNYKGANVHEDLSYRTQVKKFWLDAKNSKWQISEKKSLKLPKFQKPISQEQFRVQWKNFAYICFLWVGTFEQNLSKIN